MSQNDVFAAEIKEHPRADLAGERAFHFRIEVLRAQGDAAALENLPDKGEIRKGRTDAGANAVFPADAIHDGLGQQRGFGSSGMHLPISDDEFLAALLFHTVLTRDLAGAPPREVHSLPFVSMAAL